MMVKVHHHIKFCQILTNDWNNNTLSFNSCLTVMTRKVNVRRKEEKPRWITSRLCSNKASSDICSSWQNSQTNNNTAGVNDSAPATLMHTGADDSGCTLINKWGSWWRPDLRFKEDIDALIYGVCQKTWSTFHFLTTEGWTRRGLTQQKNKTMRLHE